MTLIDLLRSSMGALAQNRVRAFLTTLGVIIGVMAVVLLVSLGTAAQKYIENEFETMGSYLIAITPGKQQTTGMVPVIGGAKNPLTRENVKQIRRKAVGIRAVAPLDLGSAKVRFGTRERNVSIINTDHMFPLVRRTDAEMGRFFSEREVENQARVCVLGPKVKQELFGTQSPIGQRIMVNRTRFLVLGVLESRGQTLGMNLDDLVVIPVTCGQTLFHNGEDWIMEILALPKSHDDVEMAKYSIRQILIAAHDNNEDFTILDEGSMLGSFRRIFAALRFMLAGLAGISLLVGGIGIMNIMLVSVRERIREVGIRKAMGARRLDIGLQFLVEAVTLSVLGGCIGILGGWGGTSLIRFLYPTLPAYLSAWAVITAFVFSFSVGVFFGVYPAIKASSVDPVEALRYE